MESEFECVIACPGCHESFDSLLPMIVGKRHQHDWECPKCQGICPVVIGPCTDCQATTFAPGGDDVTLVCSSCRQKPSVGSATARDLAALTAAVEELKAAVKDTSGVEAIVAALTARDEDFNKSLQQLDHGITRVKAHVDGLGPVIAKNAGSVREDMKEGESRTASLIREASTQAQSAQGNLIKYLGELPVGELTDEERLLLVEQVRQAVLGRKKTKDGKIVPRYKDATDLVMDLLTTRVTAPLQALDEKIDKVRHEVASVIVETVTEKSPLGKGKSKDERPLVLSLNLPAMTEFVQATSALALSTVVKRLPELFNRVEVDLRHHQHEQEQQAAASVGPVLQLLQDLDAYFVNWQKQNNITRFPEQPGDAIVPRLHEVVRTVATDNREQHRLIAGIEQYGYLLQQGENEVILQKAEVAVWDCTRRE